MKRLVSLLGLVFFCLSFLASQEQKPGELQLTLKECLVMALEKNLDISVEAFAPEIQAYSIREAREAFLPQLNLGYVDRNNNLPSNWYVEGEVYSRKYDQLSIGLEQEIPTGGRFSLSLANSTTDTTRSLTIANPTYDAELFFEFNQPLLKNFGPKISRKNILQAQNQRDISLTGLKSTMIEKIYEVEEAYWSLVQAIDNLKVREYSLEHSKDQLKRTQEAARIGIKTAIDVLSAETEVANWEDIILSQRSIVEKSEDRLRALLNLPAEAPDLSQSIIPVDRPVVEKKEITFEEALSLALEERPDVEKIGIEIDNSSLDVSYYKNQLLPQLDLRFQLYYPGQSGDLLIYRDNNPYTGEVIGKREGSRMDSFKDVFDFKYRNWMVSLNLNLPMGNFLSRASVAKARMEKEKKLLEKERLQKSVRLEISEALKELKSNENRLETSARYRELMEKKLAAEEERFRLGLTSNEWLFRYQRDYASARTGEISAIIDYKLSVAKLEKIMGINLETKNLKFRDYDF